MIPRKKKSQRPKIRMKYYWVPHVQWEQPQRRELPFVIKLMWSIPTLFRWCQRGREIGIMMIGGTWALPLMTKGDIHGKLVVVIDVNPSHWFWTPRLMKVFAHEWQCTCRCKTHGWIVYIIFFSVVGDMSCGSSWLRRNKFLKMTKWIEEGSIGWPWR